MPKKIDLTWLFPLPLPLQLVAWAMTFLSAVSIALVYAAGPRGLYLAVPLLIGGFCLSYFSSSLFLKLFLWLLPVMGMFMIVFSMKAAPILLPVFFAGSSARFFRLAMDGETPYRVRLPLPVILMAANLFLSVLVALQYFSSFFPKMDSVVSETPWGPIFLDKGLGWMTLGFLVPFSGIVMFEWIGGLMPFVQEKMDWIKRMVLSLIATSVIGALQVTGLSYFGMSSLFHMSGFPQFNASFVDPNALGIYTAMLMPAWIICGISFRWKRNLVWGLGLMMMFLMFIASSRSAFLLMGLSFCCILPIAWKQLDKKVVKALFVVFLIMINIITYIYHHDSGRSRINFYLDKLMNEGGIAQPISLLLGDRVMMWQAGLVTYKNNPLLGVGVGTYLIRMPQYKGEIGDVVNDNCGNMYLQVAAEQGSIGLLLLLFLIGYSILLCRKLFRDQGAFLEKIVFSSLLGLYLSFFFGAHLLNFEVNFLFWIFFAMLVSGGERSLITKESTERFNQ